MADLIPTIRQMLREGHGCEDIAVQLGVPVEGVRRMMRGWQKTGVIKAILKNEAASEGQQPRTGLTETLRNKEQSDGFNK